MNIDIGQDQGGLESLPTRNKTSLRLKYEAETRVFRARFGGLEEVRKRLGLSRRQICQILLVDPSAWTRWCRNEDRVPPHIYRALEWYLTLEGRTELYPQLSRVYLNSVSSEQDRILELENRIKRLVYGVVAVTGVLLLAFALLFWRI